MSSPATPIQSQSTLAIRAYTTPAVQATTQAVQAAESAANETLLMLVNKIRDGLLEQQALEQEKKKLLDEGTTIAQSHIRAISGFQGLADNYKEFSLKTALARLETINKEISRFQNAAANHTCPPLEDPAVVRRRMNMASGAG